MTIVGVETVVVDVVTLTVVGVGTGVIDVVVVVVDVKVVVVAVVVVMFVVADVLPNNPGSENVCVMCNTCASVWAYVASEQTVADSCGEQVQFEHNGDDSF